MRARAVRQLAFVACVALVACERRISGCFSIPPTARVELVETAPIDTDFDHPELRETYEVCFSAVGV